MAKRIVAWLVLLLASATSFALVVLAVHVRAPAVVVPVVQELAVMRGFRTAVVHEERLGLRVSGDAVRVRNTRAFGPFSFGFMHSISADNVTVDTYPEDAGEQTVREDGVERLPTLLSSLGEVPGLLAERRGALVAGMELAPVKIVEHLQGKTRVVLVAAVCAAGLTDPDIVCRDGVIDPDGAAVQFTQLSYDLARQEVRTWE